jgi:hypothetical protein
MQKRTALFSCLGLFFPSQVLAKYFPKCAFAEEPYLCTFLDRHYSKYLMAMAEPSLLALSEKESVESYRFIWLRTYHRPVVYRINIQKDGSAFLRVKTTSGAGGYEPGRMVVNKRKSLTSSNVGYLLSAMKELEFWSLPTNARSGSGLDGSDWILEGVRNGKYQVILRRNPKEDAFRRLLLHLVSIGGVKVGPIY